MLATRIIPLAIGSRAMRRGFEEPMTLSPEMQALIERNRRQWEIREQASNDNEIGPATEAEIEWLIKSGHLSREAIEEEYRLYLADPANYGQDRTRVFAPTVKK